MELQASIAKANRYSSSEQGDKAELIERPKGGISIILAEGKVGGKRSTPVTMKSVHKLMSIIADGVHDGAASRAVLTGLQHEYQGKASLSLNLISCDLESNTIVITKNNRLPVIMMRDEEIEFLSYDQESESLEMDPSVYQFPIEIGMTFILFSDGIFSAGSQLNQQIDLRTILEDYLEEEDPTVSELAEFLLTQAVSSDTGRPRDDMSVVVMRIAREKANKYRKINIQVPL